MKKKIIFTMFVFFIIAMCSNIYSFATFEITNFVIDSELSSDGNLHVTEKITYYTDEVVNGLTRKILTKNPRNKTNSADLLELNSVKVNGELCTQVSAGVKGQNKVFEYTAIGNSEYDIKLYSPFDTSYKLVEYDYVLNNVAVKYNDIGELFWNFIGDEWDCEIQNLTINIILPQIAATETSYVFGHGSDNGTFAKHGNYVTLIAYNLNAYQPLDARILFSRNAISDSTKTVNKDVLNEYIAQEEGLSSKMEDTKIIANLSIKELSVVLSGIIIIAWIISYVCFDKEVRVEKIKYYREMPFELEPELLQYIYYGKTKSNSFYIGVLNLIKLGVYKLEKTVNKIGKETQKITYNPNHTAKLKEYQKDMIKTINGFLVDDENGEKSLDLLSLAEKMERSAGSGFRKYKNSLESEKKKLAGKPTKAPKKITSIAIISMVCLIFIIVMASMSLGDPELSFGLLAFLPFITGVYSLVFSSLNDEVAAWIFLIFHCGCFQGALIAMMVQAGVGSLYVPYILLFILIQYLMRIEKFPKEERQIIEYVSGLKRYIKHYSLLNEKDSLDYIELWEDYFIMAIALGLNNKTINYFYNYGKEQNSNLGYSMNSTSSYMNFHNNVHSSISNYQKAYQITSSASRRSSYSGSRGGFSGGSSSGGGGGRRRRRWTLLKI